MDTVLDEAGQTPRWHFDTLPYAFRTTFQVLTDARWTDAMYDGMRAVGTPACVFFLAVHLIGNYLVRKMTRGTARSGGVRQCVGAQV